MKHIKQVSLLLMLGLMVNLSGCGSSNNRSDDIAPTATGFTDYVSRHFSDTADDTDPVDVNGVELSFGDQDNPDAFQSLL